MNSTYQLHTGMPSKQKLRLAYLSSFTIVLVVTIASIAGILSQASIYPTEELRRNFMPNDVVNLLIGVPILLGSMWFTYRGKLIGLLLWPGALLFVFYNYLAYLFAVPFSEIYLLYLILVALSAYTFIGLIAVIDRAFVKNQLQGQVPERLAGGIISGLGLLFLIRVVAVLVLAIINETVITRIELSVLIADFLISPALIIGGILLWRKKALGYVSGTGFLFQLSMLFVGLIIFMILQPVITRADFILMDVIVVFIMGLVCFIPFGLFIRGVMSATRQQS